MPPGAVNVPRDYFSLAGFEVFIHGRFWVFTEAFHTRPDKLPNSCRITLPSCAPVAKIPWGDLHRSGLSADLDAFPEDGKRSEIIDGELFVSTLSTQGRASRSL
jgi:hypothetical protein